ncbi:alpha,alpha-trehalose-phosphate synthase [UDP-forming] 6-like protein [Tanacetum coccineum]|uniref:Alpha,alpha-trehalose-phosphate synthase [UDP-forming] 6-like protein n=1 Tax=Tanacetum coccineum TaxID=301880 RepID=A0ABQ5B217_9ASTR
MLKTLCRDKNIMVFIVSARSQSTLGEWFASCEKLGLAAEHKCFLRVMADDTDENDIDGPDNEHDVDWHMMHSMTTNQKSNTNSLKGAYVEAKLPQQ